MLSTVQVREEAILADANMRLMCAALPCRFERAGEARDAWSQFDLLQGDVVITTLAVQTVETLAESHLLPFAVQQFVAIHRRALAAGAAIGKAEAQADMRRAFGL